ncbi:MAG: carbon starvation protein A [Muribaculaceae bacterium]|nr:carbon starvation protein A [Muribaculaceae bacterium]
MITFLVALAALIAGYFLYGALVDRIFGVDASRPTPAITKADGVDFIPLPSWRIFLIQFLNIAGLGPIFGAIMGALYGPAAYMWIVFGTIFGGAVHDYLSGMLSLRRGGVSLPEIVGDELGNGVKQLMRVFSLFLLILVGAVFVINPAELITTIFTQYVAGDDGILPTWVQSLNNIMPLTWWFIILVFVYYLLATLLPIDKIIGKFYPIFGMALLFMAVGVLGVLLFNMDALPEITDGLHNRHPQADTLPIFPMMFISIACGAVSGFHATQSPLMARCLKNEKMGRPIFYGAMVTEGILALIWAAAAVAFTGSYEGLAAYMADSGNKPLVLVNDISVTWLGSLGGFLALLGVIFAPITSGDTALRSARLIAADFLHVDQSSVRNRLFITIPIFVLSAIIMMIDFNILWRYFAWSNQALSVFTFWSLTVFLARERKGLSYLITLIPALFMTVVCVTYIMFAPEGLSLNYHLSLGIGLGVATLFVVLFARFKHRLVKI